MHRPLLPSAPRPAPLLCGIRSQPKESKALATGARMFSFLKLVETRHEPCLRHPLPFCRFCFPLYSLLAPFCFVTHGSHSIIDRARYLAHLLSFLYTLPYISPTRSSHIPIPASPLFSVLLHHPQAYLYLASPLSHLPSTP